MPEESVAVQVTVLLQSGNLEPLGGLHVTVTWKHRTAPGVYEAGDDVLSYAASPRG